MLPLRAWLPRLSGAPADAALAVCVAVISSVMDAVEPHGHAVGTLILWDVALAAPLIVRRRAAGAAAAVGVVCLAQWAANVPTHGDLFVPLTLYTLGVRERRRVVLLTAAAAVETGIVLAAVRWSPGTTAWLSALTYTGTAAACWLFGVYVRTRRAYVASMVARAEAAERDRDLQATIAVDAERARIAREMHDIITHSVSVMITLNDAAAAVSDPHAARQTVRQSAEVGRRALTEMQRMLTVLRHDGPPDMQPQPGMEQLPALVAVVRAAGPSVQLSVTGDFGALPETVGLTVYRLVQESLTNVLKHGRNVTGVEIDIAHEADHIAVTVRNDGDRVSAPRPGSGHGLTGMRERVSLYGGHLEAAPGHRGGWQVHAALTVDVEAPGADGTMPVCPGLPATIDAGPGKE
jgi:signal transduction histidine kinase